MMCLPPKDSQLTEGSSQQSCSCPDASPAAGPGLPATNLQKATGPPASFGTWDPLENGMWCSRGACPGPASLQGVCQGGDTHRALPGGAGRPPLHMWGPGKPELPSYCFSGLCTPS